MHKNLPIHSGLWVSDTLGGLTHRRKSPQWFGLRREHAEVVVHDQEFLDVMREYCVADEMIDGRRDDCTGRSVSHPTSAVTC